MPCRESQLPCCYLSFFFFFFSQLMEPRKDEGADTGSVPPAAQLPRHRTLVIRSDVLCGLSDDRSPVIQVLGVCASVVLGMAGLAWPFLAPALRRHCLPFVPASDAQARERRRRREEKKRKGGDILSYFSDVSLAARCAMWCSR
jgi:hypothetical protein